MKQAPANHRVLLMDYYALTMAQSHFSQGRQHEIAYFDYFFRTVPDHGGYAIFAGLTQVLDYLEFLHFTPDDIAFLRSKGVFTAEFLDYLANFRFRGDGRAHGGDAAHYGARAAYIGGVAATANTYSEYVSGIPVVGTMAHAFVQSFDSEYEAFLQYAKTWPDNTVLLVDTYDTLRQGIPNAIRVHNEYLAPRGHALRGIRIDSGDLAYLSNRAREMLDAAGLHNTKITVSNSLDEYLIKDLVQQGAAIDNFGVGERLITAKSNPVFGGVYKIVALEKDGAIIPKIKISETLAKTTTPGYKQLWRLYDAGGKAIADVITLHDETIDDSQPYELFDPEYPWKRKTVTGFRAEKRLQTWMEAGARSTAMPSLADVRAYCQREQQTLWDEIRRLENPHGYYVDLSQALWQLKQDLIREHAGKPQ